MLTPEGRSALKSKCEELNLSSGDLVETLVREQEGKTIYFPASDKKTGLKGGRKSLFFGKTRGTTTAVAMTKEGRELLDSMAKSSNLSRGDMVEYLLRSPT